MIRSSDKGGEFFEDLEAAFEPAKDDDHRDLKKGE